VRAIALASEADLAETDANEAQATFIKGDALRRAQDALVESTFNDWLQLVWAYDKKYAFRFMKVSRNLSQYRERLVAAGMPRVSLFHLARVPERAEDILEAIESGQRLSVSAIHNLISRQGTEATNTETEVGGAVGLKAYHNQKWQYARVFLRRLCWIYNRIQISMDESRGRRLRRRLEEIVLPARLCQRELRSLCLHPIPDGENPTVISWSAFQSGSGWNELMDVLQTLGRSQSWPRGGSLAKWLQVEVLPVLDWSIGDSRTGLRSRSGLSKPPFRMGVAKAGPAEDTETAHADLLGP
jgi:hypothetical protein